MKILGQEVAPQGMGCWAIGGDFFAGDQSLGFADVDDETSIPTVHAALDAGIRVFDTADVYGAGHSEKLLGTALRDHADALIISKFGARFDEQSKQVLENESNSDAVIPAIESSLRRLQRESIDIMLLHLNSLPVEKAAPFFDQLELARQSGKIRAYGWSTDFPASVTAMAQRPGFVAVEHAMHVFMDVPSIQSAIETSHLTALIRSPLAMGILTGKFDSDSVLPRNDVRSMNSDRRDYFLDGRVNPRYLKNLAAVRELLQSEGRSLSQGALGWLMARSTSNLPLPGARTVAQIEENAGALEHGPLPSAVMAEIETLVDRDPEGEPRAR